MSTAFQHIGGHDQVLRAFGYWPSFHDAEVLSLLMDRNTVLVDDIADARLDGCLHAFEWTRSLHPVFNHHLVQLRFHEIDEVALDGFNHQNAILEFRIEDDIRHPDVPGALRLTFVPAQGLSGSFCACRAEVLSVVPYSEQGRPRKKAEPGAAPTGGPAAPVDNLNATEGPPSVS